MHSEGHLGAALLAYAPVALVTRAAGFETAALGGVALVVALAMLPDADMSLPFVPHRGPTHTVWFAGGVGAVLGLVALRVTLPFGVRTAAPVGGFVAGVSALTVLSHVAVDALTPAGVRPYAPVSSERYAGHIRAANPVANYLIGVLGVLAVGVALYVGGVVL